MNSAPTDLQRLPPPRAISAGQTLLWFAAGVTGMFLLVSAIFALKLGLQGQLPFQSAPAAARQPAPATPPAGSATPPIQAATAAATPSGSDFESGSDGILPPEAAHLSKVNITTGNPAPAQPATTAPAPAATSAPGADPAIGKRVQAWAGAWESKAIDDYLEHYAADFQPAGKLSHADWLAQRRQRLARPGAISLEIRELDVQQSGDTASARFVQTYRANGQTLTDRKTLEFVRRDGQWRILREYTAG